MKMSRCTGIALAIGVLFGCSSEPVEPDDGDGGAGGEATGTSGSHAGASNPGVGGIGSGGMGDAGMAQAGAENGGAPAGQGGEAGAPLIEGDGGQGGGDAAGGAAGAPGVKARPTWNGTLPDAGVCSVHGWCWAGPVPVANAMKDVWGTSPSDVWAVGVAGTITHYDGVTWTGVTDVGNGPDYSGQELGNFGAGFKKVHGSAVNDVWILGNAKQLLHWNGTVLQEGVYAGAIMPRAVWAHSAQAAWLVGDAGSVSRWNGSTWTDGSSGTGQNLEAVWGFSTDDVWVAGGSVVRHWTGSAWEDRSTGLPGDAALVAIWGASPSDVWAVGKAAYRYVAGTWTVQEGAEGPFVDVTGASPNKVLFLSEDDNSHVYLGAASVAYAYDGGCLHKSAAWAVGENDFFVTSNGDYTDSAVNPEEALWCVLGSGDLHANDPVTSEGQGSWGHVHAVDSTTLLSVSLGTGTLRELDGGTFQSVDCKVANVATVSGRDDDDIWVSTSDGQTSHFDGAEWTVYGISSAAIGQVAVGEAGTSPRTSSGGILYEFDGQAWSVEHTFAKGIASIAIGTDSVWVATPDGEVWEGSGDDWAKIHDAYAGNKFIHLSKLGLDGSGRLWRVLTVQEMLGTYTSYFDGEWHETGRLQFANDMDVRGNEVWTLSEIGPTYRFDGQEWVEYRTGGDGLHWYISIAGPGDVWLSGEASLLHYTDP